jgi:hypothetical protein
MFLKSKLRCCVQLQLLIQLTDFHETWYERYAIGDQFTAVYRVNSYR